MATCLVGYADPAMNGWTTPCNCFAGRLLQPPVLCRYDERRSAAAVDLRVYVGSPLMESNS